MCKASLFKADDNRLKGVLMSKGVCTNCDVYKLEDAGHIVVRCQAQNDIRGEMSRDLDKLEIYSTSKYAKGW